MKVFIVLCLAISCCTSSAVSKEISNDNVESIVRKITEPNTPIESIEALLDDFIESLYCSIELNKKDDEYYKHVFNSFKVTLLDKSMQPCSYEKDAKYIQIEPTGSIKFSAFIIPYSSTFLSILWPE